MIKGTDKNLLESAFFCCFADKANWIFFFNEWGFQEKERLKNTLECFNDLGKTREDVGKWRKEMN